MRIAQPFAGAAATCCWRCRVPGAAAESPGSGEKVQPVFSEKLVELPGKRLTAVVVTYAPGGRSGAHHHAGTVFAYVLSGAIRSQLDDGAPRVFHAGETFFEPPGTHHRITETPAPPSPRACSPSSSPTTAPS